MAKCKKCMRPGPVTSNGYLNFLREYRKKHCNLTAVEVVRKGACAWNKLSCAQKRKYAQKGCGKPSRSRSRKRKASCGKSRSRSRSRSRKRCGSSKRSRSRSRSRKSGRGCGCKRRSKGRRMNPGPLTSNGYLNFLRGFRRKVRGLKPQEVVRQGARQWCSLPQSQKDRYNRMACKVTHSKRHKRSKICRALRNRRRKC